MDFLRNGKNIEYYLFSIAVFLFFSLFLALPSGYSYGAVCALIGTVLAFKKINFNRKNGWVVIYLLLVGLFFSTGENGFFTLNSDFEIFWKYAACALIASVMVGSGFSLRFIVFGMCIGACVCINISLYEYAKFGRADGFTNAIRYGNLSALIGCWLLFFGFISIFSDKEKVFIFISSFFAFSSSLLSLSRGGWLVFGLAFLFLGFAFYQGWIKKIYMFGLMLCVALTFLLANGPQRITEAWNEVQSFTQEKPNTAATSVGARLEMYRFALQAIKEKPLLGWGDSGAREELERQVEQGKYNRFLVTQPHLHNEFLDTVVRKGIFGGAILFLIYMVPLFFIWKEIINNLKNDRDVNLIRLSLATLPLGYFLFGLTDLFFHINISHLFYAFSLVFFWSSYNNMLEDKI